MAGTSLVHSSAPDPVGSGHARLRAHGGAGLIPAYRRSRAHGAADTTYREEAFAGCNR